MMQPRCAVCDGDNDVMTLCDAHTWLTHVYALVYTGGWSDWPLPDYCEYGPLVSHRQMMTSVGGGSSHGWQAQLAVLLTGKWVMLASLPEDSPGDWLAVNGLLDLPDNGMSGHTGQAA